jgi:hypothetical protein
MMVATTRKESGDTKNKYEQGIEYENSTFHKMRKVVLGRK